MDPLDLIDIVISIYNQEKNIELLFYTLFLHTTTPFQLILVFDGCTDASKDVALRYIEHFKPRLLKKLIVRETPNLFETKANNVGFKLSDAEYMITLQDDVFINETGWERRLTYPLRKFDSVFAVTARIAQDIEKMSLEEERYMNRMGSELGTLPRDVFAVRDVLNRGPVAFRMSYLRTLNFLNESYAPCNLDDADISLRGWNEHRWLVGVFAIRYFSPLEWGKTRAKDSTMDVWGSNQKNKIQLMQDHGAYLATGEKHDREYIIPETEIDYRSKYDLVKIVKSILFFPYRSLYRFFLLKVKARVRSFIHR